MTGGLPGSNEPVVLVKLHIIFKIIFMFVTVLHYDVRTTCQEENLAMFTVCELKHHYLTSLLDRV